MNTRTESLRRGARWLGLIVAAAVALFGLVSLARVGHMFWAYHQLNSWATTTLGLDSVLAMFVAIVATTAVLLLLPSVLWYALVGRRLREAAGVAVGFAAVVTLLVSTVGRDVCFDRASGRPLCYVAETPDGLEFSRTPGVDPKYGIAFVVYTSEMAIARGRQSSETGAGLTEVIVTPEKPFTFRVLPNHQLDWFGEGVRTVRRDGADLIITYAVEKKTTARYEYFRCTPQRPCANVQLPIVADAIARPGAPMAMVLKEGEPYRLVVPPGHRWELIQPPSTGWTTDSGSRDDRGNRIQLFEVVPPAREITLQVVVRKCATPQDCSW